MNRLEQYGSEVIRDLTVNEIDQRLEYFHVNKKQFRVLLDNDGVAIRDDEYIEALEEVKATINRMDRMNKSLEAKEETKSIWDMDNTSEIKSSNQDEEDERILSQPTEDTKVVTMDTAAKELAAKHKAASEAEQRAYFNSKEEDDRKRIEAEDFKYAAAIAADTLRAQGFDKDTEFNADRPFPFKPYGPFVIVEFIRQNKTGSGIILVNPVDIPIVQVVGLGTTCQMGAEIGDITVLKGRDKYTKYDITQIYGLHTIEGRSFGCVVESALMGKYTDLELLSPKYHLDVADNVTTEEQDQLRGVEMKVGKGDDGKL